MYNLLEKLRAGEPFTDKDRDYNSKALVPPSNKSTTTSTPQSSTPTASPKQQVTLEVLPQEEKIVEAVEQQKWPTKPKAQLAAIRDLLRTTPGEWSAKQIAAQFKGNITKKKLEAIVDNCDRLEWFGLIVSETKGDIAYWHYVEATRAA